MSELHDKLGLKRELPRHLRELALLTGRPVHKDELLSLEETRALRLRASQIARPVSRFKVPFEEKQQPRFAAFLRRLTEANASNVYIWTPASNLCGVLPPLPLAMVRMNSPFDLNPEGIIVILTSDLHDQLLLDYSTGDGDEQLLEVEVSGEHWEGVAY